MFSCVLRREICFARTPRQILSVNNHIRNHDRLKTGTLSDQLPDNVPILKPLDKSSSSSTLRIKTINKAMKAYLERARSYEDFLKVKNVEFEIGKQHLANMMGLDATTLTQNDIDRAIEYLLPSGLFEKKARPHMKPPQQLYPREKAAQFDSSGRPYSPFFYAIKSNYYTAIHQMIEKFHELDAFEDRMIAQGILAPPSESLLSLGGGNWHSLDEMQKLFLENITEEEHSFLVTTLNRLAAHPYSFRIKDELWKYRTLFPDMGALEDIPEPKTDSDGRPFMDAVGRRKNCVAKVIVRGNGTGKVQINGTDISFFPRLQDREQLLYPLQFTNMLGKVDVEADVTGIGGLGQAGAIRHGLSMALRSFVPVKEVEKMRLAGLLIWDTRAKGRKIYGQKGHRAKYKWKKR